MAHIPLPSKTLDQALSEVEARFLYNLPEEELNSPERLFFQIEQAYWYYEDFKADRYTNLPHFGTLKTFAQKIFAHCEILQIKNNSFQELFADYASYKSKIPVCGCIMLNPSMTKVVLVCDWNGKSWMFPRGKINQNETELQCAIRETQEETGFNASQYCNENDFIISFQDQKKVQLFIASNVPEDTVFECQTRKEISKIEFHALDNLPKRTYHVHPFIPSLNRWISQQKKNKKKDKEKESKETGSSIKSAKVTLLSRANKVADDAKALAANSVSAKVKSATSSKETPAKASVSKQPKEKNVFDAKNGETFDISGTGNSKQSKRWSVQEMFQANAKITGKQYDYNGNPHEFGSYHPRYVNYAEQQEQIRRQLSNDPNDKDFLEFSLQSRKVGEKMLRGVEYVEEQNVDEEGNTSTRLVRKRVGSLFAQPFTLFTSDIMDAVDKALAANPVLIE